MSGRRWSIRSIAPTLGAVVVSATLAGANGDFNLLVRPSDGVAAPVRSLSARAPAGAGRAAVAAAVDRHAARFGIPAPVFHALVKRESGYNPRAIGPRTKWGRAIGPTQILCSTAASLGEGDCNRLLRDADRAVELAALYLRQGYAATGSWRGAAAYYHGGPNRALHGRRTAAYALAVAGGYGAPRMAWNVAAIQPAAPPAHDFNLLLRGG